LEVNPITQSRIGENGTCFRACIASIFNLRENQVVDFDGPRKYLEDVQGLDDYWANVEGWLAERGLYYQRIPIDGKKPVGWSTIEGVSPRGGLHACVAYNGKLVRDPHPQDSTGRGLVEPRYYGLFKKIESAKVTDLYKKIPTGRSVSPKQVGRRLFDPIYSKAEMAAQRKEWEAAGYKVTEREGTIGRSSQGHKGKRGIIMTAYVQDSASVATDRTDMTQLRKNTHRQDGPFLMQVTKKNSREHTLPTKAVRT
jgi:hypothetical protein